MTKKWLLAAALCLPAALRAADFTPSIDDLKDPARALSRSTMPVSLASFLLDAGEGAAVEAFAAGLPPKHSDLANKMSCLAAFYKGNVAGAVQSLENIEKPDPWVEAEKKYLQDLLVLQADFTSTPSDHFIFRASKKDAFLSQYALPALERAYEKASAFYTVSLATVTVEVYSDPASFAKAAYVPEDSLERTGLLYAAKFGRIYLLSPRAVPAGFRWLDALAAGYQKLVVNNVSGALAPSWLKEGLARHGEAAWRHEEAYVPAPAEVNRLAEAALVNPSTGALLIPFSRMEPNLRGFPNQDEVLLSQVETADAIDGFLKEQGADKLLALLGAFRKYPRDAAFTQTLGQSESDFEASAWIKSLEGRQWTLSKGAMDRAVSLKPVDDASLVPAAARAALKAGDALRDKRQWALAAVQYKQALALSPDNGVLLARAAAAAQAQEDFKGAEQLLRKAVDKNPFYVPPFVALGQLLYDDSRYDEAQKVLQEGLEIQPCHPRLHETLGLISLDVADIPAARRSLTLSLEFDPSNQNIRDALSRMPK
jgi:tetratricopeptide (TPR) repeat protein